MTAGGSVDDVVASVRERVEPDADERRRLQETAADLVDRAERAVADLDVDADVLQVGSTARDTWVSGDRDIDVFVRFPPDLPRADLERIGLQVGAAVLPHGREEYADHPYVTGVARGFDVDLVPCYRLASARDIQSPVDRTPFHNEYVAERLSPEEATAVRLLKQFLKGIGAYGSDLKTRGFSGYLTELLVLEYGDFAAVLEAVADWRPPVHFDPEGHGAADFDDPLVVIDPTDPERNVAAVVAAENVARLQHHARAFLDVPTEERFFPSDPDPLSPGDIRDHVRARGTTPLAIRFDPPDVVEDQLYPQLHRSLDGLVRGLEGHGFAVLRSLTLAEESALLLVELAVAALPAVERHEGPPVFADRHARDFYEKYADADAYGPFIDGDRYVVERERSITDAATFVDERLFEVALGAQVETALADGYDLLVGEDIGELSAEFGVALARYFDPTP
ncbi:MAG: CCA tRNA nucleotidyltransferase [Halanaeroarchaeum sp.]